MSTEELRTTEWDTCVSVVDLAVEPFSRGFEGPTSGFSESVRVGDLVVVKDELFCFCDWKSVDRKRMISRENDHLVRGDIRPCDSLRYLVRHSPCGFLEKRRQKYPAWLEWAYVSHIRLVFLQLQETSLLKSCCTPDGCR